MMTAFPSSCVPLLVRKIQLERGGSSYMVRRPLTLARALKLAQKPVRDDDSNAEPLIELFLALTDADGDATKQAIRTAVLKAWYSETEDFRDHFREYIGDVEKGSEQVDDETIESNAPAS